MPDSFDIQGPGGWETWARRHAMIDEQEAAQAALDGLRAREAGGEHIAQSAIAEAVRRAACSDLAAQFTKRWKSTP